MGYASVVGIEPDAFSGKSITSITFPSTIELIPEGLLKDQTSLTNVTFADDGKLYRIGKDAFAGCTSLSEVTIPDGISSIAEGAFAGCTSLTEVTIPDSVTQFGENCFPKSTTICCTEDSPAYTWFTDNGYNVKKICMEHSLTHVPASDPTKDNNGCMEHWYCPKCGKYFSDASGETELTEAEVFIPYFQFEYSEDGYYKLTGYNGNDEEITVPTVIPDNYPVASLRGQSFSIINQQAFKGNSTLKKIVILNNIETIDAEVFMNCENLTEITIGNILQYIGRSCFNNSPNIATITIYSKRTDFLAHSQAFEGAVAANTVYGYHNTYVESTIKLMSYSRFVGLEHIYGEPSWNWDGYSSATAKFTCSKNDDTQTVNATVTSAVTKEATYFEPGVRTYTATATINDKTYTDVKTEEIPVIHSLEYKGTVYPTVDQHGTIEHWYCPVCGKYFSDPNGMNELTEDELVLPYFTFVDDGSYIKLTSYNGIDENVTVPEKIPENYPVESLRGKDFSIIKEEAFKGNATLKKVVLQDNIEHIADEAFEDCGNLTEVTIGTNLNYIGQNCFEHDYNLEKITIYSKKSSFQSRASSIPNYANLRVYGYHDTQVEASLKFFVVPFVGLVHTYGAPKWTWNGYSSAIAEFTCTHNDDTQTVEATITSEVVQEPTCLEEGVLKHTATVTFEGQTYTDEKTEPIPTKHKLQHKEKVYPTVEKHGTIECWYCPECGKYFSDENGEHPLEEDEIVLPYFTFVDDGQYIKLTSYNGNDESVLVPDKIPNDYPDESLRGKDFKIIREDAFKGNPTIRNVIMLDNISHIGARAFQDCPQLEEVTIGKNLDTLNDCTFGYCPSLKKVTIYSTEPQFTMNSNLF